MDARRDPDRLFAEFRRSGDPRALGEVYDLLAPELLRVALHTAREPAEAEDVLQATFLAAIEQAERFDPARRVLPWLVGILANEARKARERGARRPDRSCVRLVAHDGRRKPPQGTMRPLQNQEFEAVVGRCSTAGAILGRRAASHAAASSAMEYATGTIVSSPPLKTTTCMRRPTAHPLMCCWLARAGGRRATPERRASSFCPALYSRYAFSV